MDDTGRGASAGAGSRGRRTLRYALGGAALAVLVVVAGVVVIVGTGRWSGGEAAGMSPPHVAEASPPSQSTPSPASSSTLPAADAAWLQRVSGAADIPERALGAYAMAALTLADEQPGCRLGWNMLAGIGKVESEHGSIDGSRLLPSGETTPRIIGVPLDGTEFLATPDTDGGAIDGDALWDRAVGPMQFIPSTWHVFGRDGNGDGRIEIDQIDDAALSASALLCDPGLDLTVGEHWVAALDGYNPSASYNNDVADAAEYYAQFG